MNIIKLLFKNSFVVGGNLGAELSVSHNAATHIEQLKGITYKTEWDLDVASISIGRDEEGNYSEFEFSVGVGWGMPSISYMAETTNVLGFTSEDVGDLTKVYLEAMEVRKPLQFIVTNQRIEMVNEIKGVDDTYTLTVSVNSYDQNGNKTVLYSKVAATFFKKDEYYMRTQRVKNTEDKPDLPYYNDFEYDDYDYYDDLYDY